MNNINDYGWSPYGNPSQGQYYKQPSQPQLRQYAFVNGIEGAKSYQLQPNQNILLMDSDALLCYRKESDAIGKSNIRYFQLTEIDEATARGIAQPQAPQPSFASKEDIENINKRMDEIFKLLSNKQQTKKENRE